MSETDEPLVSVISVVWNEERRLRATLDSLVTGLDRSSELMIVDGGSTDSTLDIVGEYQTLIPGLRVLHQNSRGLYAAMNEGSAAALGKYLYFLNAGDRLCLPCPLERIARNLYESGSTLGLASVVHETAGRIVGPRDFELEEFLRGRTEYNHQGSLFERKSLLAAGGYDPRFGIMADFALMARLATEQLPEIFDDVLAYYEGDGISESRSHEIPYLMHDVRCSVTDFGFGGNTKSYAFAVAQGLRRHGFATFRALMSRRSASV